MYDSTSILHARQMFGFNFSSIFADGEMQGFVNTNACRDSQTCVGEIIDDDKLKGTIPHNVIGPTWSEFNLFTN